MKCISLMCYSRTFARTNVRPISSMVIHWFTYSLILLFINSLVRSLTYWLINWSVDLLICSLQVCYCFCTWLGSPQVRWLHLWGQRTKRALSFALSSLSDTLCVSSCLSISIFFYFLSTLLLSLSVSFLSFFVLFFLSYPLSSSLSVSLALSSTPLALKWAFSIILC